jgi:autotransporter-associated beta strand protein
LTGGPGTQIYGQTSSSGTVTWSIGGLNTSTTFAGGVENKSTSAITALTKVGTGTLTLTGLTNTYTGATTVNAGTLQIGDGGADGSIGTGAISIGASGALAFNSTLTFSLANNISGTGPLVVLGGAVIDYTGTDTAPVAINSGYFALGSSGAVSGQITVAAGSTFDVSGASSFVLGQKLLGAGYLVGPLTVTGGTLSPAPAAWREP